MSNRIISAFDLEKIEEKSERLLKKKTSNQIIHREIINYSLDGFEHLDNPEGLTAKKLITNLFFLTCPKNNLTTLEEIFEKNNIFINSYIPSFLSLSELSLQPIDKKLGTLLVDYGAEKTSVILIEKNKPINYFVLKIGSRRITEKIAIEEKISFQEAEKIKKSTIKNQKVSKIIKKELNFLAQEINKILKK
jgi:cell division protein FtsA